MTPILKLVAKEKYLLAGYCFMAALLFFLTRNFVDSADLIQYFSLADQYRQLPLYEAANDFWSPFLSWLLIPFKYITGDYLSAFKTLQLLLCLKGFLLTLLIVEKFKLNFSEKVFFSVSSGIMFLGYGIFNGSPDLLYLDLLLFIIWIFNTEQTNTINATVLGISGGILYLSKSFGLVFFPVFLFAHFALLRKTNNTPFRFYLISFAAFIIIAAGWIFIISKKNHSFTYSGASVYNFTIMNPAINPDLFGEVKHPIDRAHFAPVPNRFAVSAWQEPNHFDLPKWSPCENIGYYLKVVFKNVLSLIYYYFSFFMLLFAAVFLWLLSARKKIRTEKKSLWSVFLELIAAINPGQAILLLAAAITTCLYVLVLTQKRYLWINEIGLLSVFFFVVRLLSAGKARIMFSLLCILVLVSFAKEFSTTYYSKLNNKWIKDPVFESLLDDRLYDRTISDIELGSQGYTVNSVLSFKSDKKNYGMLPLDSLQNSNYKGYFLSGGNHTINTSQFPFLKFIVYSSDLNCSLYKVDSQ